jgi:hypothetical protein
VRFVNVGKIPHTVADTDARGVIRSRLISVPLHIPSDADAGPGRRCTLGSIDRYRRRRLPMWARIASFEGGDTEKLQKLNEERMQSGEMTPPEGMKHVLLLADNEKNRRMFVTLFESREELDAAEPGFEAMGDEVPEDVRGRRTAVDYYEVVFDEDV